MFNKILLFLKIKLFKNFSQLKSCQLLFLLYGSFVFFILLLLYIIYLNHLEQIKHDLENESNFISDVLKGQLDSSSQLVESLSKQIAAAKTTDYKKIATIIGKDAESDDALSFINIGWIDSKGMYVFDRNHGFINPPSNLSHRPYLQDCINLPWKLHMSQVVIGASLGIRKIPGGMGVTDHNGKYLGTLCMGLKLADVCYIIKDKLLKANFGNLQISYIVLDKDLHIVIQSPDNKIDIESSFYKDNLGDIKVFMANEGHLFNPITYKDIVYKRYRKVPNYPYYVLTGLSKEASFSHYANQIYPFIISLIILCFFYIIVYYLNQRIILKSLATAEKAKQGFLQEIKKSRVDSLELIRFLSKSMIELFTKKIQGGSEIAIKTEKQIDMLQKIYEASINIRDLTPTKLNLSSVNINLLIQECILIQSTASLVKGVKIKAYLYPNILQLTADCILLKQIIVGLISLGLEYSLKGSSIKIFTALKASKDQEIIELIFEDNGFALSSEDIDRIDERRMLVYGETGLEFSVIKKLINLHSGYIKIEPKPNNGKRITVSLPCNQIFSNEACNHYTPKEEFEESETSELPHGTIH